MVSPVQLGSNSKVYFRGNDDLFSSPGKFTVAEETAAKETPEEDTVELSQAAESPKKKGGIGKAILGTISGIVLLAVAAWGIFKGKGDKWINKEAKTTGEKFKNILAKPGEWIDNNIVKKISNKINAWRGKGEVKETAATGEATEAAAKGEAAAAGETAEAAAKGESAAAGEAAETAAKGEGAAETPQA